MSEHATCPICGTICRVAGDTTLHYEPVGGEEIDALRAENRRLLVVAAWISGEVSSEAALKALGVEYLIGAHPVVLMDRFCRSYSAQGRALVEGKRDE